MSFSPLETRYKKDLSPHLSEQAWIAAQVFYELKYLHALMQQGCLKEHSFEVMERACEGLGLAEIEAIESRTHHATRSLVEAIAARLMAAGMSDAAQWVHVGITSFDTVDTASRIRLRHFINEDYFPDHQRMIDILKKLAIQTKEFKQVGRTHGQWAVPSYLGLVFAEAAYRLKQLTPALEVARDGLCGQASGAVGAYQGPSLILKDPIGFEKKFINGLGLKVHLGSTQIIPPEDVFTLASVMFQISSVLVKVANDLRHLARSEIAEVFEGMQKGQVGSSTMPQKRNPWNLEHVCSLYKVLSAQFNLLIQDQVSEHQRDLTNSASGRFSIEFFCLASLMQRRLIKVLPLVTADESNLKRHLSSAGTSILAEALYIEATKRGLPDAHNRLREMARTAESKGCDLWDIVRQEPSFSGVTLADIESRVFLGPRGKLDLILREL